MALSPLAHPWHFPRSMGQQYMWLHGVNQGQLGQCHRGQWRCSPARRSGILWFGTRVLRTPSPQWSVTCANQSVDGHVRRQSVQRRATSLAPPRSAPWPVRQSTPGIAKRCARSRTATQPAPGTAWRLSADRRLVRKQTAARCATLRTPSVRPSVTLCAVARLAVRSRCAASRARSRTIAPNLSAT